MIQSSELVSSRRSLVNATVSLNALFALGNEHEVRGSRWKNISPNIHPRREADLIDAEAVLHTHVQQATLQSAKVSPGCCKMRLWVLCRSSSWGHHSNMCCSFSVTVAESQRRHVLSCLASDG